GGARVARRRRRLRRARRLRTRPPRRLQSAAPLGSAARTAAKRSRKDRETPTPMSATLTVQLFGTKKCQDTRKAERFFRERGVALHVVDLGQKGMSAGELRNVAARVGGIEALIDREGKRYIEKGLK